MGKKVSVIIPVYKAEQYLDRCVRSVLGQTHQDLEVILVDDGSPDKCPQMCDEWAEKDSRIRVIHRQNGGASAARNDALRIATGDHIAFVDSDDWIEPQMYARLVELMERYEAEMVFCGLLINNGRKKIVPVAAPKIEKMGRKECLDRFFRLHGEDDTHCVCGGLFSRGLLEGYSFVEGRMNEDVHACYVLAERCRAAVQTNEVFYNYYRNEQSVTNSRFGRKNLDLLYMWEQVSALTEERSPEYAYACEMNSRRARLTLLGQMYFNGYDRDDPEMRRIKRQLRAELRASFFPLLRWKMPLSRKALLCALVL